MPLFAGPFKIFSTYFDIIKDSILVIKLVTALGGIYIISSNVEKLKYWKARLQPSMLGFTSTRSVDEAASSKKQYRKNTPQSISNNLASATSDNVKTKKDI